MRPPHDPPRRRRTAPAVTVTALLAAVFLLPGTALASPDTSAPCDEPLVTYTRDGADGDQTAVALTAQSIERDVDGWDHVTWSAASGTALTGVYATDVDGTVTRLDTSATGTAVGVVALTFCGSSQPVTASTADPAEVVVEPEPAPESDGPDEDDVVIHIEFEPEAIIKLDDDATGDNAAAEGDDATGDDAAAEVEADGVEDGDATVSTEDVEVVRVDGDEGEGEGTSPSNPHSGNDPTSEGGTPPSNPHSGDEATSSDGGTTEPAADPEETEVLGVRLVAGADGAPADTNDTADTDDTAENDTADPVLTQAATSGTEEPTTPFLPVSVQILLALAALLGIAAAIRAGRSKEMSR